MFLGEDAGDHDGSFRHDDILDKIAGSGVLRSAPGNVEQRRIFADNRFNVERRILHHVIHDTFGTDEDHRLDIPDSFSKLFQGLPKPGPL